MVKTRTKLKVKIISATKFITTHCQFDGINHWPGVINGDEVSKSRISPFIVEIITKHPKLDVHLLHTRMSSNSSGQNKNKIKGVKKSYQPLYCRNNFKTPKAQCPFSTH